MKKTLLILLSVLALHEAYGQVKATSAEINAGVDDDKFATALAMQGSKYTDQSGSKLYAVTAAGANTYTATIAPAITAYSAGQIFFIKITTANTGASTLNLNGLGTKSLVKDAATALASGELLAGRIYAIAYDGTNFQVVNIASAITGTNLNISGNGTVGGGLGVGSAGAFPHIGIYNSRTLSGLASGGTSYGLINGGAIQSDVTGAAMYNQTLASTAASSFTLPVLVHYNASQATLGAGSAVTSQIGYSAESTLIGATNNYGFYGAIPTGTNRYNLYMTGTAQNHLRGVTTLGGTTSPLGQLSIYPNDAATKGLAIKANGSQMANLLEVQDAAGTPVTSILGNGLLTSTLYFAGPGVSNGTSNNNALVALNNTGTVISRNIADNNPALSVNLANASSTGAIATFSNSGNLSSFLTVSGYYAGTGIYNLTSANNSRVMTATTGTTIQRDVADANHTLTLDNINASNTGYIQQWRSGGTGVAFLTKGGTFSANNLVVSGTPTTSAGSYSLLTRNDATGVVEKISASSLVSGSSYIQNGTSQQTSSNFNISGNGIAAGYGRFDGGLGIGSSPGTVTNLLVSRNISGGMNAFGQQITGVAQSDVTNTTYGLLTAIGTAAAPFTTNIRHIQATQGTFGAGSTVTSQYGFYAHSALVGAANNFGFYSDLPAGTNRFNFFANGNAQNYFAGNTSIGALDNHGTLTVRTLNDASRGIVVKGYSATQSANLQEWLSSSGTTLASVSATGVLRSDLGLTNFTNGSYNAFVNTGNNGTVISRNIVDANPALVVNSNQGTGNIQLWQQGATEVASLTNDGRFKGSSLLTTQARPATETITAGNDWASGIYVSDVLGHTFTGNNWNSDMATVGTFRSSLIRGFQISSETSSNTFRIRSLHTVSPNVWRTLWHDGNLNNLNQLPTRNFADLQNKPTTLAGYGITEQFSKYVAQTSFGNATDQNYWTKIATINFGSVDYKDCNLQLGFASTAGTLGSAVVDIAVRQHLTGQAPSMHATILSAGSGATWLSDDSFKLVSEGYGTNFDLYVRKSWTYGSLRVYEILANNNTGSTVTYFSNQGWSVTEPTATYMVSSSGLKYKTYNIYHAGNNNILSHPIAGFTIGANTAVSASDNIKSAVEKLQGQVNNRLSSRTIVTDFDLPTVNGIIEGGSINTPNQPVGGQWGTGIQFSTNNNPSYLNQLIFTSHGELYNRSKSGGAFSAWAKMLTSANFNTYSPALSGTGATGTWGIGISGNAATATTLATARTINGVAFNGSANITITDATREPAIAAGTSAQYQRGDKTWQTLNTTAVPEGTNQYFSTTRVLNTTLTGYSVGGNTALASGDTHLTAFGKIQGQLNNKANDASVVHLSNNETVAGIKKFSDAMTVGFTGTIPSGYKLAVGGNIIAEAVKVKPQGQWPDYVFEKNYPKLTLAEVEEFIAKNKHLPEVPSAAEVKKDGIDVGEMNAKLLKKVEELTLYLIEMKKENETLKQRMDKLEKK